MMLDHVVSPGVKIANTNGIFSACYTCSYEGCQFETDYCGDLTEFPITYEVYVKHEKYVHLNETMETVAAKEAGGWGDEPPKVAKDTEEKTPTLGGMSDVPVVDVSKQDGYSRITLPARYTANQVFEGFICYLCERFLEFDAQDLNIKSVKCCKQCGRSN